MSQPASQNEPTKRYVRGKDDLATIGEGGALVGSMLPDQHKADFAEINVALDQTTSNLKDPIVNNNPSMLSNPSFKLNKNGKPLCYFAAAFDTVTGKVFGSTNPLPIQIVNSLGSNPVPTVSQATDNIVSYALAVMSLMAYINEATSIVERVRTPTKWFNSLVLNNGSTAIWTSAVGKKARLMGIRVTLVNGTTAAAACKMEVLDVAADTGIGVQICGAIMAAVGTSSIIMNETYMNGYLMAATNTAININLSSALAVAGIHVQVWGTEE